jgi:hypothetical protein
MKLKYNKKFVNFTNKKMKVNIWYSVALIVLVLTFSSCDISKRAIKNKTDRELNESSETITKRIGDTVSYKIPNIIFKDTTIYTVNKQGTTLRTVYNESGQISQIDCFASMIEEINRTNKQLIEAIKDKDSEKTEKFDSTVILYIMIGLSLIVLIVAYLGFKTLNKHSLLLDALVNKIK